MYTGVALSGVYTNTKGKEVTTTTSLATVYGALKQVVLKHPNLALLIHGQSTQKPSFTLAPRVDLAHHVVWYNGYTKNQETEKITEHIGRLWQNIEDIPPWTILVFPYEHELSVSFVFHHSLGDGTSGKIFLFDFCKALNSSSAPLLDDDPIVEIPRGTKIPPSLEEALEMPQSFLNMTGVLAKHVGLLPGPNVWKTKPTVDTFSPGKGPLKPKITRQSIAAESMQKLLTECRRRGTTVTALIMAIAVVSLDSCLLSDDSFTAIPTVIPRNLRPLIDEVGANGMGVYVASIMAPVYRADLRTTTSGSLNEIIWKVSGNLSTNIKKEVAKKNYDLNSGMLKLVPDLRKYFLEKVGKSREGSIEVSSLLAEKTAGSATDEWSLDDLYFAQGANAIGDPIMMSVISYKGGALNMACTWASEYLEDSFMAEFLDEYKKNVEILVSPL